MIQRPPAQRRSLKGCLTALRHDTAGNTLAIMAAAIVPMIGMTGSAIDVARMYYVKVRLQQACDAGALAGRKFMDDANVTSTLDSNAAAKARQFFDNNFSAGSFGSTAVSFTPVKTSDSQVAATATATVPMTIMKYFGGTNSVQNVTCEARLDLADVDIMFVLDTTGSMACASSEASCTQTNVAYTRPDGSTGYRVTEKSDSKIVGLRSAVLSFYDTMASNADPSTNLRYGLVPYASSVNVGFQLNPGQLVSDTWQYQSRQWIGDADSGSPTSASTNNVPQTSCVATPRTPATGYVANSNGQNVSNDANGVNSWYEATSRSASWASSNGGRCTITTQKVVPNYRYGPRDLDVSAFVTGAAVPDPTKWDGPMVRWQGCIEERDTETTGSFDVADLPPDLDPDLPATSRATRWRPAWGETAYLRTSYGVVDATREQANRGNSNWGPRGFAACGKAVQRLAVTSRAQLNTYLTSPDFVPLGGTYHDVGMIWGTRLMAPNGPFAADTAAWPNRNAPNRNLIFMTDGQMAPQNSVYGMYGHEFLDRRVTSNGSTDLLARHNTRFAAVCAAAKARNITVWVIGFGSSGTLSSDLTTCASPGKTFYATDSAALANAFRAIATQIAELRISQ